MMPLNMVDQNQEVKLVSIVGGLKMKQRLADLGLNIGMTIRVLKKASGGPMIIAVKDSRLALGWGMANRIIVEPVSVGV
jgi:ferrous iron transport protein A